MNVGDKVWVEAVVTRVGADAVDVAVQVDPNHPRVSHVRTHREAVRLVPGRKPLQAA